MELAIIIGWSAFLVLVAFRIGWQIGMRAAALKAQSELMRGATLELSEGERHNLALQLRHLARKLPTSSVRSLDDFVARAFVVGRLVAEANWKAGVSSERRKSRSTMNAS